MKLFGRKKAKTDEDEPFDPESDEGIIGYYHKYVSLAETEYVKFVSAHLARLHEPGGVAREKRENDFIELGMPRTYLEALDEVEFAVVDAVPDAATRGRARGKGHFVTRWTVSGVHNRPLAGLAPSGQRVTIEGATFTTLRDYRIRTEYTYWQLPELTRRVLER